MLAAKKNGWRLRLVREVSFIPPPSFLGLLPVGLNEHLNQTVDRVWQGHDIVNATGHGKVSSCRFSKNVARK